MSLDKTNIKICESTEAVNWVVVAASGKSLLYIAYELLFECQSRTLIAPSHYLLASFTSLSFCTLDTEHLTSIPFSQS